jgi:hypothetical protein
MDKYVKFAGKQYDENDWRRLPAYQLQVKMAANDTRDELIQKATALCDRILNGDYEQASLMNVGAMAARACETYFLLGSQNWTVV